MQLGSKPHTPELQARKAQLSVQRTETTEVDGVVSGIEVGLHIPCEGFWSVTKYGWAWFSLEADGRGHWIPRKPTGKGSAY